MKGMIRLFKIIIFDGHDGSGKTTLIREFNKATRYKYFCIDRLTASAYVYDQLRRHIDRTEELVKFEDELSNLENAEVYYVCLIADFETATRRLIQKKDLDPINTLGEARELYLQHYEKTGYKNKLIINTTKSDIKSCVERIRRFVENE